MAIDPIVRTYDPKAIIVTFGPIIFSGYMDGTFLTIAKAGPRFEKHKGADGAIDRVNKNEVSYTVTATLKQTSLTNDLLSAVVHADLVSNTGVLPLLVKDLRGTSLFVAPQAWIVEDPDDEWSDSMSARPWMFDTGIAEKFTGGSIV